MSSVFDTMRRTRPRQRLSLKEIAGRCGMDLDEAAEGILLLTQQRLVTEHWNQGALPRWSLTHPEDRLDPYDDDGQLAANWASLGIGN